MKATICASRSTHATAQEIACACCLVLADLAADLISCDRKYREDGLRMLRDELRLLAETIRTLELESTTCGGN